MKKKFLLGIFIILAAVLVCTACRDVAQKDIDREYDRYWVIYEKMVEGREPGTGIWEKNELLAEQKIAEGYPEELASLVDWEVNELLVEVGRILGDEFAFVEDYRLVPSPTGTIPCCGIAREDVYRFARRQNQLMERALVRLKGVKALWEIRGDYEPEIYGHNIKH